jgi:hypothetical protein
MGYRQLNAHHFSKRSRGRGKEAVVFAEACFWFAIDCAIRVLRGKTTGLESVYACITKSSLSLIFGHASKFFFNKEMHVVAWTCVCRQAAVTTLPSVVYAMFRTGVNTAVTASRRKQSDPRNGVLAYLRLRTLIPNMLTYQNLYLYL